MIKADKRGISFQKFCKKCNSAMRNIPNTNVFICDKCGNTLLLCKFKHP